MEISNLDTISQSVSGPLQQQEKNIPEVTRRMTLPGKPNRPLKKRRVVSTEPDGVPKQHPRNVSKPKRKKAPRTRAAKKQNTGVVSPLPPFRAAKLQKNGIVSPSPPSSPASVMKKSVVWNVPGGNMIHLQPDLTQLYPHFNESDLWLTRDNYKEFLLDRLQTIDSHRQMTANNMNDGDNSSHCIRGLELFEDDSTNEHFKSMKKLYYSTIKMEQMRQGMLGIKDPQRFRDLVAAQSDLDLHRARKLAAQDEREIYPFRAHSATQEVRTTSQDRSPSNTMPVSSFSDMHRQNNLMGTIYGSAPPSASETNSSTWNSPTPNSFHENEAVAEFGAASVVSDVSSTSSSESCANGQSVFADESIRKLQERSMRRLMGIYNNGEGTEGPSETNSLFKFARRDSLLGIGNSTTSSTANASNQNNVRAVTEDNAPSQKEQIMEMIHRRQLLQDHHQQQQAPSYEDTTPCLQDQIVEMVVHRQLLQDHLQQQQQQQDHLQQQQQQAFSEDPSTSLVEQVMEMVHRRKVLEDQQQEQQHHEASSIIAAAAAAMGQSMGGDNSTNNPNSMVEQFLIQQQQHQQEHKLKMQQALIAMNATRFPIRRDTLSHVNPNAIHDGTSVNHHQLPWNVTSMT